MNLAAILERIDLRLLEMGLTDRAASLKAGGSDSLIRNLRRRSTSDKAAGINLRTLRLLASVLEVDTDWLLTGAENLPSPPPNNLRESDVRFDWRPGSEKPGATSDPGEAIITCVRHITPGLIHPAIWKMERAISGFSLAENDILVVDLKATAATGDIVLVTKVNEVSGEATTHLRQYFPPYLILPGETTGELPLRTDDGCSVIMALVAAMFRLNKPSLAS